MSEESALFTYGAPFVGVLLVAIGIAAAVPGAYAILQNPHTCGNPTISVESPAKTADRFGGAPPAGVARLSFEDLTDAEQRTVRNALDDPFGEAELPNHTAHYSAFDSGAIVTIDGKDHYVTNVAPNNCYNAASLQFPLGVFAIALGIVGILTPPGYRRLIKLEEGLSEDA